MQIFIRFLYMNVYIRALHTNLAQYDCMRGMVKTNGNMKIVQHQHVPYTMHV